MKRIKSDNYESVVYVSHPYLGKKENEDKVAEMLKDLQSQYPNYLFVSPIHAFSWAYGVADYDKGMDMCLWLLENCDEMWILSASWKESEGCRREVDYCLSAFIPVFFQF